METTTLAIDLAKNVFQLYGIDESGKKTIDRSISRASLYGFMANLPECIVIMEACGGSHYWGRKFRSMGHNVKLVSPQHVKPFVGSQKNDRNDARAILECGRRLEARFVSIKEIPHQDMQALHRVRERMIRSQVSLSNQIRGLLHEYGLVVPVGPRHVREKLFLHLENVDNELSDLMRETLFDLHEELKSIDRRVDAITQKIKDLSKKSEVCQRLEKISGVGPIVATAFWSSIANPHVFKNGRQVSAWIGLVPKQRSSGGKARLGRITKTGQVYLRKMIVQGARAQVMAAGNRQEKTSEDLRTLAMVERKGFNKAAVALANRNVRRMWSVMAM